MVLKDCQMTGVTTATVIGEKGREVFCMSSGQMTDDKETWWWKIRSAGVYSEEADDEVEME